MADDPLEDLYAGIGKTDDAQIERFVAEINERIGGDLELVGAAEHGGSGGAVYVRWPDGRDSVFTRTPTSLAVMQQTADVLELARSRGLPVPDHELILELSDRSVAVVQQRLPGTPPARVDASTIDAMVAMNERFAGLLVDRPDVPIPPLYLRHSGPIYPRHDVLDDYSDRSRALLARIRELGQGELHEMAGDDLLHPDYTLGNVLYDKPGHVSGVVDWNWGAGRGDRRFALVRTYTDLYWSTLGQDGGQYGVQTSAFERLDQVLSERIDPAALQTYWAHMTLNQLHWAIQYHSPEVVDLFLRFGESRLI